ncbi:hypothetical protein VULLAG_LOCUS20663 [Vulpes lagopus]
MAQAQTPAPPRRDSARRGVSAGFRTAGLRSPARAPRLRRATGAEGERQPQGPPQRPPLDGPARRRRPSRCALTRPPAPRRGSDVSVRQRGPRLGGGWGASLTGGAAGRACGRTPGRRQASAPAAPGRD